MKSIAILSAALILAATAAHAHEGHNDDQRQQQYQGQGQYQRSTSKSNATSTAGSNTEVVYENLQPANTAVAAPLAVGSDSCMGSSSVGGQTIGFGLSVGSTWHDDACERRKDAVILHNLGEGGAAIALMCQDDKIAAAMKAAGRKCPAVPADSGSGDWPTATKAIDR